MKSSGSALQHRQLGRAGVAEHGRHPVGAENLESRFADGRHALGPYLAGGGGRRTRTGAPLLSFMKRAYFPATHPLPAPVSAGGRLVVRARCRRDGHDRPDPAADGRGDQLDPGARQAQADHVGDRDRGRRPSAARAEQRPPAGGRAGVAGRRARPAQHALRAAPASRARLLRPPADRAADVARHRRPAVGALLPRLRADLHRAVGADDRARRGGHVRASARAGRAGAGAGAVRRADRQPLRRSTRARRCRRRSSGSPS